MALVWLCCGDWLASVKNKMLPQEEIGTKLMTGCPSSLFFPEIKRLEMLFLVLVVTSMSSYPQHHNLFGLWQELDPSFNKTLAPAHATGEISACLKCLAALGQNNVWSAIAQKQCPVSVRQAEGFPQPLCTHRSSPTNILGPHCTPGGTKCLGAGSEEAALFALLLWWSTLKSVPPKAQR